MTVIITTTTTITITNSLNIIITINLDIEKNLYLFTKTVYFANYIPIKFVSSNQNFWATISKLLHFFRCFVHNPIFSVVLII